MKRRDEVLVGILVTVATAVAILGTLWLARGGLSPGYPLFTRFAWGAGLKQGQPVQLAGVNVGYVNDVELRQDGTLLVELRINNDEHIPANSTATVIPVGIFGDAAIALTPTRPSTTYYTEGDTVPAGKPTPTIQDIIARMDTVGTKVSDMTNAIELQLVQRGGLQDLRQAIANTNSLILQLNAVAAEQSRQLSMTQAALRRSVSAIDSASVDSTVRNLRATSANMAELTGNLRQTSTQLNAVLAKLEGTDGTAGKLLNDPQLYNDLRSLVTRVDSLTADFKKNPRRYINLEIF